MTDMDHNKYFHEGYLSCQNGDGFEDNPYKENTYAFNSWFDGFESGLEEFRHNDEYFHENGDGD